METFKVVLTFESVDEIIWLTLTLMRFILRKHQCGIFECALQYI